MDAETQRKEIEITPEMVEAGGWAHAYWRLYSDEPSDEKMATSIFNVMIAVGNGRVTAGQEKDRIDHKTGRAFFERFSEDLSAHAE